jgi:hypothetical protein
MSTPSVDDPTIAQSPPPEPPLATAEVFDRDGAARRVAVLGGVAIVIVVILILRLWSLQVLEVQS